MKAVEFNQVIEDQLARSSDMLFSKNDAYNPDGDKLKNFKTAAELQGVNVKEALRGMMAKHTVSIYDMCGSDQIFPEDVWNEKITDSINYLLLLQAVVTEEREEKLAQLNQAISEVSSL